MKIIIDANIVFSAILNTNGKIGNLILNPPQNLTFKHLILYKLKLKSII